MAHPHSASTSPARPTASRWVRAAVWALFVLVLLGGVAVVAPQTSGVTFGEQPGVAAGVAAGPIADSCGSTGSNCRADYEEAPHELLPAWRWRADLDLHSHSEGGITDVGGGLREGMTLLANVGFAVSNLVWSITLNLIKFATTIDYLGAVGARINQGFVSLSEGLIGIIGILWLVVLLRGGKLAMKGDIAGIFRSIALFVLPIAFLFYFHTQAAADAPVSGNFDEVATEAGRAGNVQGSPVWLAQQVTDKMNMAVEGFAGGITLFGTATSDVLKFPGETNGWPNCEAYIQTLYDEYNNTGETSATSGALEQVSKFWAVTTYGPWMDAQFGDNANRGKVACQILEQRADIPAAERQAVFAQMDGGPSTPPSPSTLENGHGERVALARQGHSENRIFSTINRDRWMAFAACTYDGSWKVDWRWVAVGDPSLGKQGGMSADAMRDAYDGRNNVASPWCATWWEKGYAVEDGGSSVASSATGAAANVVGQAAGAVGGPVGGLAQSTTNSVTDTLTDEGGAYNTPKINGTDTNLKMGLGEIDDAGHGASQNGVDSREAGAFIGDFYGSNGVTRMMLGLLALISSLVYLFVLGGVAFGALLAQFGLVLLLIFLPITLIGLAAGADFGRRMTKLTIALCGSKLLFTLLLSVMTQLTMLGLVLFSKVTDTTAAGVATGGIQNSVASAMVPLLTLFIVNRGLSSMGLAKLTSLGGALAATGQLAGRAAGQKGSVAGFLSNKAQGGGKITNAARKAGGAAVATGKDYGKKAGGAAVSRVPGANKLRHRALRKDVARNEQAQAAWRNSDRYKELAALSEQKDANGKATEAAEAARKELAERDKSFGKATGSAQQKLSRAQIEDDRRAALMRNAALLGAPALAAAWRSRRNSPDGTNELDTGHFADALNPDAFDVMHDAELGESAVSESARAVARSVRDGDTQARAAAAEIGSVIAGAEAVAVGESAVLRADQLDAVIEATATRLNIDPSSVIATSGGLPVPDIGTLDVAARAQLAQTEWAAALLLPDEVTGVREIADGVEEAMEDRARRIVGAMASIGALTVDGGKIQIAAPEIALDQVGVDLGTAAGAQLWRDFTQGLEDALADMPRISAPTAGTEIAAMWDAVVNVAGPDTSGLVAEMARVRHQIEADFTDTLSAARGAEMEINVVADSLDNLSVALDAGGPARAAALDSLHDVREQAAAQLEDLVRDALTLDAVSASGGNPIDLSSVQASIEHTVNHMLGQLSALETDPGALAAHLRKVTAGLAERAETAAETLFTHMNETAYEVEAAAQASARTGTVRGKILDRLPRDPRGGI